jgi:hypothetical protein
MEIFESEEQPSQKTVATYSQGGGFQPELPARRPRFRLRLLLPLIRNPNFRQPVPQCVPR